MLTFINESPDKINSNDNIKEIYTNYIQQKVFDENEIFQLTMKMIQKLGESIETGVYLSKSVFIRREIW